MGFSALTGDQHPQHTDAEWAGAGRFGERVAHGMLVLSYAVGLVDFDPERVVALRGLGSRHLQAPGPDRRHDPGALEGGRRAPLDDEHALVELGLADPEPGRPPRRPRPAEAVWRTAAGAAQRERIGAAEDADLYGERVLL